MVTLQPFPKNYIFTTAAEVDFGDSPDSDPRPVRVIVRRGEELGELSRVLADYALQKWSNSFRYETGPADVEFDVPAGDVAFLVIDDEDFRVGDVIEATTISSHPRTVRVKLSMTPWRNQHGRLVLVGEGGPVVVDPDTAERV